MNKRSRKVLFKIPSEEELQAAANTTPVEKTMEKPKSVAVATKPALEEKKVEKYIPHIDEIEGISVGSTRTFSPNRARKITRERKKQFESIARRKGMKVTVQGKEQEVSSASKYMLDMLISSDE